MLGEQRHGTGSHTTSTGDVYTGGWHYDKRHGQGTFKAASGLVYEGSWRDDKTNGCALRADPEQGLWQVLPWFLCVRLSSSWQRGTTVGNLLDQ